MVVYVLRSLKDGKYYIGFADIIEKRLAQHNSGQVKSTKHRRPLVVVYKETVNNISEARKRENQIKKMKGGIQFKSLINARE